MISKRKEMKSKVN